VKKAHGLAVGAEILGARWARDHAKKPALAAASETAFDPEKAALASVSIRPLATAPRPGCRPALRGIFAHTSRRQRLAAERRFRPFAEA
jgi:hypothetical protein